MHNVNLFLLDLAMTGEITLRGLVLPVGGIKEKVIAAYRSGMKKVIMPARNKKDLQSLPNHVRDGMDFAFVKSIEELIEHSFESGCFEDLSDLEKLDSFSKL